MSPWLTSSVRAAPPSLPQRGPANGPAPSLRSLPVRRIPSHPARKSCPPLSTAIDPGPPRVQLRHPTPTGPDPAAKPDAVRALPRLPARPAARPHLAGPADHRTAAVAEHRSPRRQPGPDRADDAGAQVEDVRAVGAGWATRRSRSASVGQPDRLRLRPPADRARSPRRCDDLGADPGARGPDRAYGRSRWSARSGDHPSVQRDRAALSSRRLRRW